ncbi:MULTISPECIES: bacteriohemerythrin [unclassified Clostridium]|uniref:bacteriohemerythrin n=1 Tax=unclassified Clostridium TaxID=2614128 RepID=UPI00023AF72A|nr:MULTISPECIES: bacteriohemerythrin [unclassified Clostridium]EHI97963.1 hemerythrin-like metal-binding protein [Clostridium sp. DL-VIII]OOM81634.1 bacteriohemerythrin [Clostridium sp. BL-8]
MNFIWDGSLSIGIDNIDNQHKELFNCIDKLLVSIENLKSDDEVIKTLKFLEDYVIKHFNEEEEIQRKTNYPLLDIQHIQHENFKNDLKEFKRVFETHGASTLLALNIQQSLIDWLKNHIMNLDKDLGDFLIEIGYNK